MAPSRKTNAKRDLPKLLALEVHAIFASRKCQEGAPVEIDGGCELRADRSWRQREPYLLADSEGFSREADKGRGVTHGREALAVSCILSAVTTGQRDAGVLRRRMFGAE